MHSPYSSFIDPSASQWLEHQDDNGTRLGWQVFYQQPGMKEFIVPCNKELEWDSGPKDDRVNILALDNYVCETELKIFLIQNTNQFEPLLPARNLTLGFTPQFQIVTLVYSALLVSFTHSLITMYLSILQSFVYMTSFWCMCWKYYEVLKYILIINILCT